MGIFALRLTAWSTIIRSATLGPTWLPWRRSGCDSRESVQDAV